MAISIRNRCFISRLKIRIGLQRFYQSVAGEDLNGLVNSDISRSDELTSSGVSPSWIGKVDTSKWKKVSSIHFGISKSMIPTPLWTVMNVLRNTGFEAYLVGGCVRDLILSKIPKDFDVITTASLDQIMNQFHRCRIVGQRFPICMVHISGSIIEVSSFDTSQDTRRDNFDIQMKPDNCDDVDFMRWRNSMQRDFTINSLFFDPFMNRIYDYANAMKDLQALKLRTLIPAQLSFEEDCARIFRGIRIAARLGLSFSKETETAILNLSPSVMRLAKSRILMELNYMMSYGASEPSLFLLQRFGLLELLLPFQAVYLFRQLRNETAKSSIMLMKLLSNLDKLITCDRPPDNSLWVGLLAFHLALLNNPQDALVVWTLSSVLYCGSWEKGLKFARKHAETHLSYTPEMLNASGSKSDAELASDVAQFVSLVQDSVPVFTEMGCLLNSMSKFSVSSSPGMVFIPRKTGFDVFELFDVLANDTESYDDGRGNVGINYFLLGKGDPIEARHVLGKIMMDTMSNGVFEMDDDDAPPKNPTARVVKTMPENVNRQIYPFGQLEVGASSAKKNVFQEKESKGDGEDDKESVFSDSNSLCLSCLFRGGEMEKNSQSSHSGVPNNLSAGQSSPGLKRTKKGVLSEKQKNKNREQPAVTETEEKAFSMNNEKQKVDVKIGSSDPLVGILEAISCQGSEEKSGVISEEQKCRKHAVSETEKKAFSLKNGKQKVDPMIGAEDSHTIGILDTILSRKKRAVKRSVKNRVVFLEKHAVTKTQGKTFSPKNEAQKVDPMIGAAESHIIGFLDAICAPKNVSTEKKKRVASAENQKCQKQHAATETQKKTRSPKKEEQKVDPMMGAADSPFIGILDSVGILKNSSEKKQKVDPHIIGFLDAICAPKNASSTEKKRVALSEKQNCQKQNAATKTQKQMPSPKKEKQKADPMIGAADSPFILDSIGIPKNSSEKKKKGVLSEKQKCQKQHAPTNTKKKSSAKTQKQEIDAKIGADSNKKKKGVSESKKGSSPKNLKEGIDPKNPHSVEQEHAVTEVGKTQKKVAASKPTLSSLFT